MVIVIQIAISSVCPGKRRFSSLVTNEAVRL